MPAATSRWPSRRVAVRWATRIRTWPSLKKTCRCSMGLLTTSVPSIFAVPSVWKMSASWICCRSPRIVTTCGSASDFAPAACGIEPGLRRNSTSSASRISFGWLMNVPDGTGFGRRSAARLTVLASVIGIAAAWSQSVRAQVRLAGVGELTERDEKLKKAMKALLLEADSRHDRGWQLARDCGPAVAPLLWDMQAAEQANQDRRALLAGAAESDEPALAAVGVGQPALQLIIGLVFAMQPSRGREQPQAPGNKDWADLYWERVRGRRKEPDEMLTVAALLGSRRFAGASATSAAADLVKRMPISPGVIAAAMFAGVP